MSKRNIRRKKPKSNPNPRHPIELDKDRLDVLTRIRQKMVLPGKEVDAKMIAVEMGMTAGYIRQVLGRQCYAVLSRFEEIEGVVDELQSEMEAA